MATRGCYGGLSKAVDNTVKLMQAFGKDIVFIETTGVGQSETNIVHIADLVVMLLVPGFGDSIQLMKAGLIEIADIIVINKADRKGGEILVTEIRDELADSSKKDKPSIFISEAINDTGISDIFLEIEKRLKQKKKDEKSE
jgi:LAO/AO transport system kinase